MPELRHQPDDILDVVPGTGVVVKRYNYCTRQDEIGLFVFVRVRTAVRY
jgi:hypothetical protein